MSIKYCENCGAAMPAESKFCTECGTPFPTAKKEEKADEKAAQVPDQAVMESPVTESPATESPAPEKPEPEKPSADPLDAWMTRPEENVLPDSQPAAASSGQAQNPQSAQNLAGDHFSPPAKPADPVGAYGQRPGQQPSAQPSPAYPRPGNNPAGGQNANVWGRPAQPSVQNQPVSAPAVGYVPGSVPGSAAYGTNPGINGFGAGPITKESLKGTPFEPVGAWGWVGIFLLMGIPIVNLVLLIAWACGGCRKNVKKSYARGTLLMILITVVLFLVIGTAAFYALFPVVEPAVNEILEQFGLKLVLG